MMIRNIKISDFRNIIRADVNFNRLNLITGKNSSGKSNFLISLAYALSLKRDYGEIFDQNIVTCRQGKSRTIFKTTVEDIARNYFFSFKKGFLFLRPETFVYEKKIEKRNYSCSLQSLYFLGEENEKIVEVSEPLSIQKKIGLFIELKRTAIKTLKLKEVYSYKVLKSINNKNNQELIQKVDDNTEGVFDEYNNDEKREKYKDIFGNYQKFVINCLGPREDGSSVSYIYNYVTDAKRELTNDAYERAVKRLKMKRDKRDVRPDNNFYSSKFIFLLADIQADKRRFEELKNDLKIYTQGIITSLHINTIGSYGPKGSIVVDTPHGPKDLSTISSGTAVLLYFIVLKNWVKLPLFEQSYTTPGIMIFDEIDSALHPSLIKEFAEVLEAISVDVQLFIATHSPVFIDNFSKEQIYLVKDNVDINGQSGNNSNIYSYQDIFDHLTKDKDTFLSKTNSELFIDGLIDKLF